jgi:hypothetical protein
MNVIDASSTDLLFIETTTPHMFEVKDGQVYGVEMYMVATEFGTGLCDYRTYTGAIKVIGGTGALVGPGFTEIISAQDANLMQVTITPGGGSPETLRIRVQSTGSKIQVAARINTITLTLVI